MLPPAEVVASVRAPITGVGDKQQPVYTLSYEKAAFSDTQELYAELKTGPDGLLNEEAKRRLQQFGPNVIPSGRKVHPAEKLLLQFKNLFNILLLVASLLSFLSGWVYGDMSSVQLGLAILIVVVLNSFFSFIQEYRAEKAVQAISKLVPTNAKVVRDGDVREVCVGDVVPGDITVLEEGDRVPADARLVSAYEVTVDNAILTGESEPQRRFATMSPTTAIRSITDYQNIVFAGTTIVSGAARGVVLHTGRDTQFGKLVSLSIEIAEPLSPLQKEIDYTAKVNSVVAILVSIVFFAAALVFVKQSVINSILFAIGVMISLVPEGFQLTVSLALALTALSMSRRNVVVKRLSSVETLGAITVMCVDKTGTITSGEMMVKKVWTSGGVFEVTGDGYSPEGHITIDGRRPNHSERAHILKMFEVAAFCNNAKLNPPTDRIQRWSVLGDPTDGAFLIFAGKGDFNAAQAVTQNPRIGFIPFDSKRRMMTGVNQTPDGGVVAYTKGSCMEVLSKCSSIFYNNDCMPLDEEKRRTIIRQMQESAAEGFRVLAVASRTLPHESKEYTSEEVEKDMTFLGIAALHDPPRPLVEAAVLAARRAGIKVIMVTGDHELTAETIAKRVGIVTSQEHMVVTGTELGKMTDEELSTTLGREEVVFARITPEEKLRIVQVLKARDETVAVTGDGVNDAPALMEAEVGIAMGVGGTDVSRESADIVLLDNNFISVVEGIKLGRAIFDNLRRFIYYVFTHNWAELVAFVSFMLLQVPLPLLVVQVLAIDLGMDLLPSLALTMEPPEPGVMTRPPRKAGSRLIDARILLRALFVGVAMSVPALFWAFRTWTGAGWAFGQNTIDDPFIYAKGTTVVMAGIVAAQLGNLFAARTSSESALRLNPLRNKWLLIGILSQVILMAAIIYIPLFQPLFRTSPLSASDWIFLYSLAPLILLVEEVRKFAVRRRTTERASTRGWS